ncbi:MAG: copper-binding protein [Burkholderiaceae bacterium]
MRTLANVMTALLLAGICTSAMAEWATGEIRRLDPENRRLTIKHEEIKSIDMPPMTMVFYVKDARLLDGLKPQDAVDFQVIEEGSKYMVTAIRRKMP